MCADQLVVRGRVRRAALLAVRLFKEITFMRYQGISLAVVGGLAFSQLVTLYVTPVFYTYLDELQQRFSRRRRVREVAPAGAPESAPA